VRSGAIPGFRGRVNAGFTVRKNSFMADATLAVVGSGPKGVAIAAKARALAAAGLGPPRVVLIDPGPVAGNWTGQQGYTSGLLPLGTSPEKDVNLSCLGLLADRILQRYVTKEASRG
jgi:hypothetical protein